MRATAAPNATAAASPQATYTDAASSTSSAIHGGSCWTASPAPTRDAARRMTGDAVRVSSSRAWSLAPYSGPSVPRIRLSSPRTRAAVRVPTSGASVAVGASSAGSGSRSSGAAGSGASTVNRSAAGSGPPNVGS